MNTGSLGCIIMASGMGKRFGGNKLMTDFNGKPLIQWTLEATEGIFARRVVVTRHKEVEQLCKQQGIPVIHHELPGRNDTIRLGLEYLGDALDGYMICQSDQPLLRRESIKVMAQSANSSRELIFRAAFGDMAAAPVLFPNWAYDELLHLPEGKGGRVVMMKHPEMVRTVQVRSVYELQDVDTPEDLEKLRSISKWII